MNSPLSIIIPTYKRTESLKSLLTALLTQKDVQAEIIVVDQNPPGFLDEYIPFSKKLKHILLKNPNASEARNLGFLNSSGEIVLFIDDDLLPDNDFCIRCMAVFKDYQQINCFSPLVYTNDGKDLARKQAMQKFVATFKNNEKIFLITDTISAALFFRRSYFEVTGGFDVALFEFAKTAEDQEFFLRMKKKNLQIYYVPFVEIFHDEHVPGGCDLRTEEYWITREKCVKSWAYRYRIHSHTLGELSLKDLFLLSRSSFLNKEVLFSGIFMISKQIKLLRKSIKSSKNFLKENLKNYVTVDKINHLSNYK